MMGNAMTFEPGAFPRLELEPAVPAARMLDNMRSAMARGLPDLQRCQPHGHVMHVAGGGPSLADTCDGMGSDYIAAVNGSLGYLLSRGIVPHACAVLDPGPHMADVVVADRRVRYFVASVCDPAVFDKLIGAGCHVTLWHPSGTPGAEELLKDAKPDTWLMIGGGSTMGVRGLNLGYARGFRSFVLHGLDSSFREDRTHAYPDRADAKVWTTVNGYPTRLNFLAQVSDFLAVMHRMRQEDVEPINVELRGDGLLQSTWAALQGDGTHEGTERTKYEAMWRHAGYRVASPGHRLADEIAQCIGSNRKRVLDFGVGTGRCAAALQAKGYDVVGFDIAANCLDDDVHVPLIVTPLWDLPDISGDFGVCCDVMEHIPTDKVDAVLSGIARSVPMAWFHISSDPDAFGTAVGAPLHLTVKPAGWWGWTLGKHFGRVSYRGGGNFIVET